MNYFIENPFQVETLQTSDSFEDSSFENPTINAICGGSPEEFGRQLGTFLAPKIADTFSILHRLDFFRAQQPWWMPYPVFRYFAQRQAREYLALPIAQAYPHVAKRIESMAEGAEVSLDALYLFHAFESAMTALDFQCEPQPTSFAACTTAAIAHKRSAIGETMIHHNFDSLPVLRCAFVLRENQEDGRFRFLTFTGAPLSGAVDGMNEHGLCIAYNYALATDQGSPGPPISIAVDDALGRCKTVSEAINHISSRPRGGAAMLMLADASGDVAALELSSTRWAARRSSDGALLHSNTFCSATMKEVEIPPDAVYSNLAPASLRGRTILESPQLRDQRLEELLSSKRRFDETDLHAIMTDHGPQNEGSSNTICMHGLYWNTTACLQLFPQSRSMRVAYGAACEAQYYTFAV